MSILPNGTYDENQAEESYQEIQRFYDAHAA